MTSVLIKKAAEYDVSAAQAKILIHILQDAHRVLLSFQLADKTVAERQINRMKVFRQKWQVDTS